jgi:hypothetical protein
LLQNTQQALDTYTKNNDRLQKLADKIINLHPLSEPPATKPAPLQSQHNVEPEQSNSSPKQNEGSEEVVVPKQQPSTNIVDTFDIRNYADSTLEEMVAEYSAFHARMAKGYIQPKYVFLELSNNALGGGELLMLLDNCN